MNRNLDFILTKFKLALLENREYKMNLYSVLLFDSFAVFGMMVIYLVIEQVSNISGWGFKDFLLLVLLNALTGKTAFGLTFRYFHKTLLSGDFNLYLTRPNSPFTFMIMQNQNGANIVSLLFLILPIVFILTLFYDAILFGWSVYFIGLIFYILLLWIIELSSFFIKENSFIR